MSAAFIAFSLSGRFSVTTSIAPRGSTVIGVSAIDGDGALLDYDYREVKVAQAIIANARHVILVADSSKLVDTLGAFPLPIEVNRFGFEATKRAIAGAARELGLPPALRARMQGDAMLTTDEGHFLIDASFGRIADAMALSRALLDIPGVVQHGLFIGMAERALIADGTGVRELRAEAVSGETN